MNRTKYWSKQVKKLTKEFESKGVTTCEIRLPGCWINNTLGFAHKHKRRWYYDKPELLGDFNQVLLACTSCHQKIENNKNLTELLFKKLR